MGFVLFTYIQNNTLTSRKIPVSSARIPSGFDGFRIVLLADGHGTEFGKDNAGLIKKVAKLSPDIIVYTGDMIDNIAEYGAISSLARGLSGIAPTYYVTGNHEWEVRQVPTLVRLLADNGVTVLQNKYITLTRGNDTIVLAGVNDPNGPKDQKTPEHLAAEIREKYPHAFVILLAHRNNLFSRYASCGYDLVLSGHSHGGLIRLPFTDGLIGTENNFFPTWTSGLYALEDSQLVVTRGLGNGKPTFRIFNPPDIPVVILHPDPS